jgi:hypothetical protein
MLTNGRLIELALGKERANRVDTAIPQGASNGLSQKQREDVAGWYYEPEKCAYMGRLLTRSECWHQIRHEMRESRLSATLGPDYECDLAFALADWPCLEYHALRGEVHILTKVEFEVRQVEAREARARRSRAS